MNNYFTVIGKEGRKTTTITTRSIDSATRAAVQLMKENPDMPTVRIENRKGEVVKVMKGAL